MLLCPISPHLAHPHSLHCSALSQAARSFWSQQQCYSINPLAGDATVCNWCCFLSYKSLHIISVMLPMSQPRIQSTVFDSGCLSGPAAQPCMWFSMQQVELKYLCTCARVRYICISDFKSCVSKKRKAICRNKRPESTSFRWGQLLSL